MPLFSPEQEATRTLQEAYDLLCHDFRYIDARYEALKLEHHALTQAFKAKEREVAFWQDLARTGSRPATRPAPTLEPTLKHLVALCHPDKWSAGQLATALAHELMIVLNDVRAQLEGPSL
jgi:hypothetical protein